MALTSASSVAAASPLGLPPSACPPASFSLKVRPLSTTTPACADASSPASGPVPLRLRPASVRRPNAFAAKPLDSAIPKSSLWGSAPSNVDYALANQFLPNVSFASLGGPHRFRRGRPASNRSRSPGAFRTSVSVSFPEAYPHVSGGLRVLYRTDSSAEWAEYAGAFWLYKDTTLQWVTVDSSARTRSPVRSGTYTFPAPPHEMDSDGDGVPDFVKIAAGLDPLGGTGAEGGRRPLRSNIFFGSAPLIRDRPLMLSPWHSPTIGTRVNGPRSSPARQSAPTAPPVLSSPPAWRMTTMIIFPESSSKNSISTAPGLTFALSTPRNFDIKINLEDPRYGRELLALHPRPLIERPVVNYVYGGGGFARGRSGCLAASRAGRLFRSWPHPC